MANEDELKSGATIAQIAQMAGVSVATVSRVINNSELVKEKTRNRVRDVIDQINYIPNKLARGLVRQTSKTIGLIVPDIANPFFSDVMHGIEDVVTPKGYSIYLFNSNYDHDRENYFLEEMAERRVDGTIISSAFIQNLPFIQRLNGSTMRIVCIQTKIDGIDCVNTTDYEGMRKLCRHMVDCGHRKIGFICLDPRVNRLRLQAYKDSLAEYGIPLNPHYLRDTFRGKYSRNPGYILAKEILDSPSPPTVIHALNDYLAFGVYQAAKERGLKIPDDISVTGFDDLPLSSLMEPPLTTVSQPAYAMGEASGELLLKSMEARSPGPAQRREVLFDTSLIIRGSTRELPRG